MFAIELDATQQKRLDELARSQGQDGASLARRILVDYLEFQALPTDAEAAWAEASVALAPEFMVEERWDDGHGS